MDGSTAPQGHSTAPDWEAIYERDAESLLRYLTKLAANRDVALDLLQDTFVRAIKGERQLRNHDSVRPWLFGIATNLARQHHRRAKLMQFLPFSGRERSDDHFDAVADTVHRALESIPFDQASALLLHYRAGFSRREIAQMNCVTEEAVKSRLSRGKSNFIAAYHRLERGSLG